MNNSIVVFDIEVLNIPEARTEKRLPGYSYANGFTDFNGLGIALICAFDYFTEDYLVFTSHKDKNSDYTLNVFASLVMNRDYCVGFNNLNFDNNLMETAGHQLRPRVSHYDILAEVWKANGLDPKRYARETHAGYGLDALAKVNLKEGKTSTAAGAPAMYQDGHLSSVINYCLRDVKLTKRLLDIIIDDRQLISPVDGSILTINCPFAREGAGNVAQQKSESSVSDLP